MIHNIMCILVYVLYIYTHICRSTHTQTGTTHIQDVIGYRSSINFMETTHPGLSNRPKISSSNPSLVDNCRAAWDKSTFDSSADKSKFLRLMGGAKEGVLGVKKFPVKVGTLHNPYEWLERYMKGKLGLFSPL